MKPVALNLAELPEPEAAPGADTRLCSAGSVSRSRTQIMLSRRGIGARTTDRVPLVGHADYG